MAKFIVLTDAQYNDEKVNVNIDYIITVTQTGYVTTVNIAMGNDNHYSMRAEETAEEIMSMINGKE